MKTARKIIDSHDSTKDIEDMRKATLNLLKDLEEERTVLAVANAKDKLYMDTVETIIVALDNQGMITSINRKGYELLGYRADELVGRSWFATCLPQPEGMKMVYPVFLKLVAGEKKIGEYFENAVITREGVLRRVAWHNSILRDVEGKVIGTLSSGEDVTLRRQAEEALRRSEEKFSLFFRTSPYAVTVTRIKDGKFIEVNDAFVSLSGYSRKEVMASSSIQQKIWANNKDREEMEADLKAGRPVVNREYLFRNKKGELLVGLFSAQLIRIGNESRILSSIANINDLKLAEEKLLELKERDEAVLESIGDAVFAIDSKGKILLFNRIAETLTGLLAEEVVGKHYGRVVKFVRESDGKLSNDFIKEVIVKNKATKMVSHMMVVRKDGVKIPVADSAAPIKNARGVTIGCVVVFRDATQERIVDRAKTEFVSLASHQLRTPMTALRWISEILSSGVDGLLNEKQQQHANEIHSASKRMIALVNAILNVSRLELGTFAVEPQPVKIQEIMKVCIEELEPQLANKKIKLREKYEDRLPRVQADPKLLGIMLSNLLTNAVKYTPTEGKIDVVVNKNDNEMVVKVVDTGVGIPKAQQSNIFTKMFRADNAKAIDPDGTGLGLYIVKEIMNHTGGRVSFRSRENKGTVFELGLPLVGMREKEGSNELI